MAFPFCREFDALVESDIVISEALRDHPQFAAVFDEERIGQVPWFFQHPDDVALRSSLVKLDSGDDGLSGAVIEILEKDEGSALPCDGKGVGIAATAGVGNGLPARAGQIGTFPDAFVVGIPPRDFPM